MKEPDHQTKEPEASPNTPSRQSTPVGFSAKRQPKHPTRGPQPSDYYPEEAVERLAKEFWQWLMKQKIPIHQWITALASVALLGVTFSQLVVSCNNAKETSPLVEYARRNTEAAEKFKVAAEGINTGVINAVTQLDRQAGSSEKVASATQTTAQIAQTALQPAIGTAIVMANASAASLQYQLNVRNEGGSATLITIRYCAYTSPIPNPNQSLQDCRDSVKTAGPDSVLPHNSLPLAISIENGPGSNLAEIYSGKTHLFMPVGIEFPVNGITRTLKFCYVYEPTFKAMGECQDLAQQNYQQR